MKSIRRGRERVRDCERPGPSENQANFSQERIKVLNKVIDVRIWWSVDDTNNYIFDKGQQISMNNDSVEDDDTSLQIIFLYKPVLCQARDKVLPDKCPMTGANLQPCDMLGKVKSGRGLNSKSLLT